MSVSARALERMGVFGTISAQTMRAPCSTYVGEGDGAAETGGGAVMRAVRLHRDLEAWLDVVADGSR